MSTSGMTALAYDKPRLGPRPAGSVTGRSIIVDRVGQQRRAPSVARIDGEHLGGAERGERHRSRPWRTLLGAVVEVRPALLAHPLLRSAPRGRAERPHAAAPAVLDAAPAVPSTSGGPPIPDLRRSTPCDSARNRKAVPAELERRAVGLGLRGTTATRSRAMSSVQ